MKIIEIRQDFKQKRRIEDRQSTGLAVIVCYLEAR
jgi:hypothetical protein